MSAAQDGASLWWHDMQGTHADVIAASNGHQALPNVGEQPRALAHVLVVLPELERDAVYHYQPHLRPAYHSGRRCCCLVPNVVWLMRTCAGTQVLRTSRWVRRAFDSLLCFAVRD